jgi:hypothetical protein
MKRLLLFSGFLCLSLLLNAQGFTFKVLGSSGLNEVKSGGTWHPIKIGAFLQQNDEVKIAANGVLGLYHASGKPLQVKEPGTHSVTALAAKVGKPSSALNKYTDFVLSTEQEKKERLAATGAVHRGGPGKLTLFLPGRERPDLLGDHFSVNWSSDGSSRYTVFLMDLHDDVLKKYEVTGNSVSINLKDVNTDEHVILVKVVSGTGVSSESGSVKVITGSRRETLKKEFDEFQQSLEGNGAIEKLVLANFFEEKLLLIDAITAYREAADLEEAYKDNYQQFLVRLGFSAN